MPLKLQLNGGSLPAVCLLLIPILVIASTVVYRLYFHPLSEHPGPILARVTNLYGAYHGFKGQNHIRMLEAHERFGKIVRIGPNKLIFNSPSAFHGEFHPYTGLWTGLTAFLEIYSKNHVRKSKAYLPLLQQPGVFTTHTAIDKKLHKRKRKVVNLAFSTAAMRAFKPIMVANTNKALQQLCPPTGARDGERSWSPAVDVSTLTKHLTLDIIGHFVFGRSFDTLTDARDRFLIDAIKAASLVAGTYSQCPRLKQLGLERFIKQRGTWTRAKFGELMKEMVETRLAQDKNAQADIFSFILDVKEGRDSEGFTLAEMWAESKLFVIAGSDTTSTSLSATLFYLSRNPDCAARLTELVRSTFDNGNDIRTGAKLASCRYLRACIDEAMRMSPPVGAALWREVCGEGITLEGRFIPAGVYVGVSLYSLHHLQEVFPEPWTYNPDRWIDAYDEGALARQRAAFNPFSSGTRRCVASNLAYAEIEITVAKILWYFDFRRPNGELDKIGAGEEGHRGGRHRPFEFQLQEHLTAAHAGPYLIFRLREDVNLTKDLEQPVF